MEAGAVITQAVAFCGLVVVPLVTSLLKREDWSPGMKQVTAALVAGGCAVLEFAQQSGWSNITFEGVVTNFAAIFTMAQAAYLGFWNRAGSPVEELLESVPLLPKGRAA